jgi:hypothetical protein
MKHASQKQHTDPSHDPDERYWRDAILQRCYYREEIGFDRYRWALRYGQQARKHHKHPVELHDVLAELADGWAKFGGPSGLTWAQARDAVIDSWYRTDMLLAEAIANHAGYKAPPTFAERGTRVPRNVDEANV